MKHWLSTLLEALAVALIAAVVAVVAAPVWALIPIAVYLIVVAQVIGRGGR